MHPIAQFLDFGVVSGHIHSSRWAQELGCLAVGLSLPLPCPQTAKPSGCKGARKPATNPCSATGASGSHPRSFASQAKLGKAGANGNPAEKQGRSRAK